MHAAQVKAQEMCGISRHIHWKEVPWVLYSVEPLLLLMKLLCVEFVLFPVKCIVLFPVKCSVIFCSLVCTIVMCL